MSKLRLVAGVLIVILVVGVGLPIIALHIYAPGPTKIQHIIFIVQENHSFDNYFGTYPRANGIPRGLMFIVCGFPLSEVLNLMTNQHKSHSIHLQIYNIIA
jgi:phospholipase C